MNKPQTLRRGAAFLTMIVTFFVGATLMADTLELSDGTILEGDFVGSSNGVIMFNTEIRSPACFSAVVRKTPPLKPARHQRQLSRFLSVRAS
jgi:hypothetical protein